MNRTLQLISISIFLAVAATAGAGQLTYLPGGDPPTLVCSLTEHCLITLPPGEHLLAISLGDPERWIVAHEAFGPTQAARDYVALRPKFCDVKSRITLATTAGLHTFPLTGACDEGDRYNPTADVTDLAIEPATTPLQVIYKAPPPPAPPEVDTAFVVEAPKLSPNRVPAVRGTATQTFLTWPRQPRTLPAVVLLSSAGDPVTLPDPHWDPELATLTLDYVLAPGETLELRYRNKTVTVRRPR